MRIDFRPTVIECRIYDKGSYKERTSYLGSFVIHLLDETAEVTLLTGICKEDACSWDSQLDDELENYLRSIDIKYLSYEHKGKKVIRNL